jgi:hypothetical protein
MRERQPQYDVTNTIRVADPRDVGREVGRLLRALYPAADLAPVETAFETFTHIYAGTLPGYHGCDTWYHDAQHSLDCTLAMARLLDGHERVAGKRGALGERRVRLGIICALFHDVGYIRRDDETQVHNGAELTLCHVTRSAEFLADFLPTVGFAAEAPIARQLVHYTGYEMPLDAVRVRGAKDRQLGFLLGTADLVAQMADRAYPEKCRDFLYHEFEACGLAGPARPGGPAPIYRSPDDLLRKTPDFARKLFDERLDGYFGSAYRYIEKHFDGRNPYLDTIRGHLQHIGRVIDSGDPERLLRRRPKSINARALRRLMGIKLARNGRGRKAVLRGSRTRRAKVAAADYVPA